MNFPVYPVVYLHIKCYNILPRTFEAKNTDFKKAVRGKVYQEEKSRYYYYLNKTVEIFFFVVPWVVISNP